MRRSDTRWGFLANVSEETISSSHILFPLRSSFVEIDCEFYPIVIMHNHLIRASFLSSSIPVHENKILRGAYVPLAPHLKVRYWAHISSGLMICFPGTDAGNEEQGVKVTSWWAALWMFFFCFFSSPWTSAVRIHSWFLHISSYDMNGITWMAGYTVLCVEAI